MKDQLVNAGQPDNIWNDHCGQALCNIYCQLMLNVESEKDILHSLLIEELIENSHVMCCTIGDTMFY